MQNISIDNLDIKQKFNSCKYFTNDTVSNSEKYEELTNEDINLLFLKLKIPLHSTGTIYLREAIFIYYYYPDLPIKLNDIFAIIGQKYNKTYEELRSSFKAALRRLNTYRDSIKCPIMKFFDIEENITPKQFLEVVSVYLHILKKKKEIDS